MYATVQFGAALGLAAVVAVPMAMAGDTQRVELNFSGVDYWSFDQGAIDPKSPNYNGQTVSVDAGWTLESAGCSNVEIDVCWNVGADYENWGSEVQFVMEVEASDGESGWYTIIAPFAGEDYGTDSPGTCLRFSSPDEQVIDFAPLAFLVPGTGVVSIAVGSTYNDNAFTRAGVVVNADCFFTLAAPPNPSCVGATGSCVEARPEPGCDDLACCDAVCELDTVCCEIAWDSVCVDTAVQTCGLYLYTCDNPGPQSNDCATSPALAENGVVYPFTTTGANTDGPFEAGCNSPSNDLPVWSDLWYMIDSEVDGILTATCCFAADFDTKIAVYDAGISGDTFNPSTLPSAFIGCNEDCIDSDFYTSEVDVSVVAGRQYLVRLGGYLGATGSGNLRIDIVQPEPPIEPQTCDTPGDDPVTQSDTLALTDGGIACQASGISTENNYCRVYTRDELGGGAYQVNCVNFGRTNSGSYLPSVINIYVDPDGGDPSPMDSLQLLATNEFGNSTTGGNEIDTVSFGDQPVCVDLAEGETLVVELAIGASPDGFVAFAGGNANTAGSFTWIRSGPCGIAEYVTLESIGFSQQWTVELSGTVGENCTDLSCPADLNDDGVVDGIDLGLVLGYWGCTGCPEDLNGDGTVDGGDLGMLVASWGACPG